MGPTGPGSPVSPILPGAPGTPGAPSSQGGPLSPCDPLSLFMANMHEREYSNASYNFYVVSINILKFATFRLIFRLCDVSAAKTHSAQTTFIEIFLPLLHAIQLKVATKV